MRLCLLQVAAIALLALCAGGMRAVAQGVVQPGTIAGTVSPLLVGATDLGAVPVSQPVTGVVLQLATTPAQQADLTQFLSAVTDPRSAQHHQWLTPAQFAARFGASAANVAALTAWLQAQGLQVTYTAAAQDFVVVSGTALQMEAAFGVQLDNFQLVDGARGFANTAEPMLPANIAALIANIRGLNNFAYAPVASSTSAMVSEGATTLDAAPLNAQGLTGAGVGLMLANAGEMAAAAAIAPGVVLSNGALLNGDPLLAAAMGIDGDTGLSPVMVMVVAGGCAASLTEDDMAWFESVAEQANAQGVTLVAGTADCGNGAAYPAILSEVTGVGQVSAPAPAPAAYPVPRPAWQNVASLPADGLRYTPDVAVSSGGSAGDAAAFAAGLALVVQKAAGQGATGSQGNVNSILYSLANDPGVFGPVGGGSTFTALDASSTSTDTSGLGVPDLTPMIQFWPLGSTASTTSLTSSNNSPTYTQSFTLTATVSPSAATGSVTFYANGSTVLGSSTLSGGTGQITVNDLAGGTQALTAVYGGDGTYATSTSGQDTVTVLPQSTTITAAVSGTPALGVSFPVAITVTTNSPGTSFGSQTPAGTITVTPQGVSNATVGNATLTGSTTSGTSTATANVTIGQAGTFTLQTSCTSSNQNYSCSSPASTQVTIAAGTTTTALSIAPNPPTPGQPITETATVTPSASGTNVIAPTGLVTFFDGTTSLGTGSMTCSGSTCTATFSPTLSPGKTHSLTAKYAGDTNFATSTSSAVSAAGGTLESDTGLSSSNYSPTYGSNVTFTASVIADPSVTTTLTPTGKVNFYANGTLLGNATLASGVANFSTTALPVGLQSITATYVGDTNFATSTSTVYNGVTVSPAAGTLTATISPASAPYGSVAVLTATLTLSNGGTPTGTISATVPGTGGGTYTGTLVANTGGSATATININVPPPGAYTITVACPVTSGTANFTCTSTTVALTATKGASATTVTFLPAAPLAGQTTQVAAVISNAGAGTGSYTFTGSVTFFDNGATIGTGAVSGNQATINVTFKANAVHSITAIYSGDTNWLASTSAATPVTAVASPTTTTLSSNYTTALSGTNLILTATVGSSNDTLQLTPTGTVTFYDNYNGTIATLGTGVLSADGPFASQATLTTTGLQGGTHSIFAIYNGDTNFAASTAATLVITEQNYSLLFIPSSLTLTRGQSAQVTVLLGAVGGFNGTITFGCTPPPDSETTCNFLPTTVASGGSTTLFIGTTAPNAVGGTTSARLAPVLIPFTAMGMLLLWPGRRKRIGSALRNGLGGGLLLLLLAVGLANTGCSTVTVNPNGTVNSGGGGSTGTNSGSPLGTNTFTITTAGTSTGTNGTFTVSHTTSYLVTTQ
jgi:trimeric autotransporter adhesin